MPIGVEHFFFERRSDLAYTAVSDPVMPIGVEHYCSRILTQSLADCLRPRDANRR